MKIFAAFSRNDLRAPTGGQVYDQHLFETWSGTTHVVPAPVRYRWFLIRLQAFAWLIQYGRALGDGDWIMQTASSAECSPLLVRIVRLLRPAVRHIGIIHHPRSLEDARLAFREERFYNKFDQLVVISEHLRSHLQARAIWPPIAVLRPGFYPIISPPLPKAVPPLIIWNGHLLPRKGAHILLQAFCRITNRQFEAVFLTASEPDRRFAAVFNDDLEKARSKHHLNIYSQSRVRRAKYEDYLLRASVFCLPSAIEGYSIATVEAMSARCAVIVPKTANFIELIGSAEYEGFFFPPDDVADLARIIDRVLCDESLRSRLAAQCAERANELPSWKDFRRNAQNLARQLFT
jgi:glycosyltransferase involved in cell wall biosynthesis